MIEITEADYRPLETFRLAWRWTESRFSVLPAVVLANIRPLTNAKALDINDRVAVFDQTCEGFLPGTFELVDQIDTSDRDSQRVRDWLLNRVPDLSERLILSWDFEDAVVTTGAIFCDYWDDFCYPSSDDLGIVPFTEEWILFYWHEEVFFSGRRP